MKDIRTKQIEQDEVEIDLLELLFQFKKRIYIILLVTILGGTIGFVMSKFVMSPIYTSTSVIYIMSKETTLTSLTDLQIGSQLTQDYKVLITSRTVMQDTVEALGLNIDYVQLRKKVSIENPSDTRILNISVEDQDPEMAKVIADTIATNASEYISEIMEQSPPKIVETGEVPIYKTRPSVVKNTAIGALLGAIAVMGIITVMTITDDTIKTEDDIEKYFGIPVLSVVPLREDIDDDGPKRGKKKSDKKSSKKSGKSSKDSKQRDGLGAVARAGESLDEQFNKKFDKGSNKKSDEKSYDISLDDETDVAGDSYATQMDSTDIDSPEMDSTVPDDIAHMFVFAENGYDDEYVEGTSWDVESHTVQESPYATISVYDGAKRGDTSGEDVTETQATIEDVHEVDIVNVPVAQATIEDVHESTTDSSSTNEQETSSVEGSVKHTATSDVVNDAEYVFTDDIDAKITLDASDVYSEYASANRVAMDDMNTSISITNDTSDNIVAMDDMNTVMSTTSNTSTDTYISAVDIQKSSEPIAMEFDEFAAEARQALEKEALERVASQRAQFIDKNKGDGRRVS